MSWKVKFHRTAHCGSLRSGLWMPNGPVRSVCLMLPGLGDYLEKRAPVAQRLAANGHAIVSLDWCGQGASSRMGSNPKAAHIDDFSLYLSDIEAVLTSIDLPGQKHWLLGYSMGATVGLLGIGSGRLAPSAVVLVSPMLAMDLGYPAFIARMAVNMASFAGLSKEFAPGENKNIPMGAIMNDQNSDPACDAESPGSLSSKQDLTVHGVTWGWSRAAFNAMSKARRVSWSDGPALIVTADQEDSVDLSPVSKLGHYLGAKVMELHGRHDLFQTQPATQDRLFDLIEQTVSSALPPSTQRL